MIYHLVWFKMKESAGPEERRGQLVSGLLAMVPKIEELVDLSAGEDFSGRSRGFEVGAVSKFRSRADLDIYATHPEHLVFIEQHKHLWQDVQALDFEE